MRPNAVDVGTLRSQHHTKEVTGWVRSSLARSSSFKELTDETLSAALVQAVACTASTRYGRNVCPLTVKGRLNSLHRTRSSGCRASFATTLRARYRKEGLSLVWITKSFMSFDAIETTRE